MLCLNEIAEETILKIIPKNQNKSNYYGTTNKHPVHVHCILYRYLYVLYSL